MPTTGLRSNSRTRTIYEYIKKHPGCTRKDILSALSSDTDPNVVSIMLNRLRRKNLIVKDGGFKDATWRTTDSVGYGNGPKSQAILSFIKENPGSSVNDILTEIFPDETSDIVSGRVRYLGRRGLIENRGTNGRGARWYLVGSFSGRYEMIATDLLEELGDIPHAQKEKYLAKRLEEIFA